jgi:hypothetical protein
MPVLTIFTPFQNQTVDGTVPLYVQADSIGTVSLQFKIDGQDFGTPITAGSCRASWDSTQTGDGLHTIQAVGLDQFGKHHHVAAGDCPGEPCNGVPACTRTAGHSRTGADANAGTNSNSLTVD